MKKDNILAAAKWRCAIRQFDKSRKVSDEDWQFLLEIARFSPSSFGLEPWNIIDVQSDKMRKQLAPVVEWAAETQIASSNHFVIFTCKDVEPDSEYFRHMKQDIQRLDEVKFQVSKGYLREFQNDLFGLLTARKRRDWAAKQAYIAMANMMLAAAEINIDSCPIEGFDLVGVERVLSENGVIDLATNRVAVMCAFGYREGQSPHTKTRRPMNEIMKIV